MFQIKCNFALTILEKANYVHTTIQQNALICLCYTRSRNVNCLCEILLLRMIIMLDFAENDPHKWWSNII